jgi:acetyl esterase
MFSGMFLPFLLGYYYGGKRSTLLTKMNLLGLFLLDPIKMFPETYPLNQDQAVLKIVNETRTKWETTAKRFELILTKRPMNAIIDIKVPSRDQGRMISVRMYRSKPMSSFEQFPVICEIHGGGWTFGSISTYDGFCRDLAESSGAIVISIDYRLAPEHRFPRGLEDCEDVIQWIHSSPEIVTSFGGSPLLKGLALCGDSAGGNISAVLAVYCKNLGIHLKLQALIYPAVCAFGIPLHKNFRANFTEDSMQVNASGPLLSSRALLFCWQSYLGTDEQNLERLVMDPRVSPIMYTEDDLRGTCPCYIIAASADVLRDECIAYGKKLKRSGVQVKLRFYENTIHGFISLPFVQHHEKGLEGLGKEFREAFFAEALSPSVSTTSML